MNAFKPSLVAAILASACALQPAAAAEPTSALARVLGATRAEPATCNLDGRQVPRGTMSCIRGKVVECTPQWEWKETGKRC